MLNTTKSVVITGSSKSESGEIIATMHFSINEKGDANKSEVIANKELYKANKVQVRKDFDEFTAICREAEDEYNKEAVADEE